MGKQNETVTSFIAKRGKAKTTGHGMENKRKGKNKRKPVKGMPVRTIEKGQKGNLEIQKVKKKTHTEKKNAH